ncbi:MAG: hypothetical protein OEY18_10040 [Candidatus Aminicenantes bacterium]|nr:hypothetical protein [Candidatus Aminicenantes bacterium]MDH5385036.1 hypothetical protein [Candidatus Aminicenantes bacterium]
MGSDWKEDLTDFFEEFSIIETSKKEALEDFDQFCEFIVEPAFESLAGALKELGIKSKSKRTKGKSISFQINFSGSRIDNFQYIICLPKNSLEMRLKLRIRGRKNKKSVMGEKEESFMEAVNPVGVLKLKKEDIIQDVIRHYRNYILEALTSSE